MPLLLTTSLFSMEGVLPFTPNFVDFVCVLLLLGILEVMTLAAVFNWYSVLQPALENLIGNKLLPEISSMKDSVASNMSTLSPGFNGVSLRKTCLRYTSSEDLEMARAISPSHLSQTRPPIYKRLSFRPFMDTRNKLNRMRRPKSKMDKQRIEWICVSELPLLISC